MQRGLGVATACSPAGPLRSPGGLLDIGFLKVP